MTLRLTTGKAKRRLKVQNLEGVVIGAYRRGPFAEGDGPRDALPDLHPWEPIRVTFVFDSI